MGIHAGVVRGARLAGVGVIVVSLSLVAVASASTAASAGSADVAGFTVSWDDSVLAAPKSDACTDYRFDWTNNTGVVVNLAHATLTNSAGNAEFAFLEINIAPGQHGHSSMFLCDGAPYPWAPGSVTLNVDVSTGPPGGYVTTKVNVPMQLGARRDAPPVSIASDSCDPRLIAAKPRFCGDGSYSVRLRDAGNWVIGDSATPTVKLYNKKGIVPTVSENYYVNPVSKYLEDQYVRTQRGALAPGKYLLTVGAHSRAGWSCSLHYHGVCRWIGSYDDVTSYTFTWNRGRLTHLKEVYADAIDDVKL